MFIMDSRMLIDAVYHRTNPNAFSDTFLYGRRCCSEEISIVVITHVFEFRFVIKSPLKVGPTSKASLFWEPRSLCMNFMVK